MTAKDRAKDAYGLPKDTFSRWSDANATRLAAAFTRVYADRYGSHVEPAENAVPVTPEAQARQGQLRAKPIARHQHT